MNRRHMQSEPKNALSIDLEDWYQGILQIKYSDWQLYENRLEKNVGELLRLLKVHNIKATFFVLGYIAQTFPGIVKSIASEGHEIASHGYSHRPIFEQSPEEFKEDVYRSKKVLEEAGGVSVKGYRAPFFSIRKDTLWALDILQQLGFEYDSSIFPIKNFLYGIPDAPHTMYKTGRGGLIEFPLTVIKRSGVTIPVCGGFYMRAMPYGLLKWGLASFNRSKGPGIIYLHPWELDCNKPKLPMALKWKIIHEYNINTMKRKLERLLEDFRFTTVGEVIRGERTK